MAHGSVRVIPACYATGQAAGTLAALATEQRVGDVREVDPQVLQGVLRDRGAIL